MHPSTNACPINLHILPFSFANVQFVFDFHITLIRYLIPLLASKLLLAYTSLHPLHSLYPFLQHVRAVDEENLEDTDLVGYQVNLLHFH